MRFWTVRGTPEHTAVVDAVAETYGFYFVGEDLLEVEGVVDAREDAWQWQARRAVYASTDS